MADYETLHVCPYHTANNVSNFGADPVTQLHFITIFKVFSYLTMLKGWVSVCLVGVLAVSSIFIQLLRHAGGLNSSTDAAQVAYVLYVTSAIPA